MLKNLKIGTRLFLLVGFLSLLLIGIGLIGLKGVKSTIDELELVFGDEILSLDNLKKVSDDYNMAIVNAVYKVKYGLMSWSEGYKNIEDAETRGAESWKKYYAGTRQTELEKQTVEKGERIFHEVNSSLNQLKEILKRQSKEDLDAFIIKDLAVTVEPFTGIINQLVEMEINTAREGYVKAIENYNFVYVASLAGIVFGVLAATVFAIFIIRGITTPLSVAVEAANKIAVGDTHIVLEVDSKDEVGDLLIAMKKMLVSTNSMATALASIASGDLTVKAMARSEEDTLGNAVNFMVEKLIKSTSELQKEIEVLSSSTGKIVTSVSEVSSSTAETASAVTETTTTVEEVKQTAQVSADKAKYVLTSTEEAIKTLKTSEKSLSMTIEGMHLIQERMATISESIIKLSELSQMIGEIIDTVNDIAEQSNLLAVNAAIEAAKAGDQGKGFAVVAQEVRSLAEQSKQATVQVHTILNDIQKATSSAVMATEQGSKAVAKGVNQSSQTTDSIRALSDDVSRVVQAASQISVSSQQQLVGVAQVTTAMTNINEATSQHVTHMRQIESAVQELNTVGKTLMRLVQQYKL